MRMCKRCTRDRCAALYLACARRHACSRRSGAEPHCSLQGLSQTAAVPHPNCCGFNYVETELRRPGRRKWSSCQCCLRLGFLSCVVSPCLPLCRLSPHPVATHPMASRRRVSFSLVTFWFESRCTTYRLTALTCPLNKSQCITKDSDQPSPRDRQLHSKDNKLDFLPRTHQQPVARPPVWRCWVILLQH